MTQVTPYRQSRYNPWYGLAATGASAMIGRYGSSARRMVGRGINQLYSKFRKAIPTMSGRSSGRGRTGTGVNMRFAGPAGRVSVYRKKRKRRNPMLRRRRVKRFRNLRRALNQIMNPRLTYVISYTTKVDQSYNRKRWMVMDNIMSNANKQTVSAYFNNKTYAETDWFFLDNVRYQFQLYNASASESYVTFYLMKCIDNSSQTFTEYLNADYVAGNTTGFNIPTASTNIFEIDRAASLAQFSQWRKHWKIVKKKYLKMEGGGTTSISGKINFKRSICPVVHNLLDSNAFYRNTSYHIVLEVRSQIVQNASAGGFVWDNATIGYGSTLKYTGGALLQVARRNNLNAHSYVTAATPSVFTDVKSELT